MIIDQVLIAGILAKTFTEGEMIRQGTGGHVEFGILAARISHDLNKYASVHQRLEQLDAEMQQLDCERGNLMTRCDHPAKRTTPGAKDEGVEIIFCHVCQVCGKTFDDVEVDATPTATPNDTF